MTRRAVIIDTNVVVAGLLAGNGASPNSASSAHILDGMLADVFGFVADAMSSPLQAVFDRKGGIAAVRNRSSVRSAPPLMGLAFEFGAFNGIAGGRFAFEVKALPNYGFRIVREQCLVRRKDGSRWWFDRSDSWSSNASTQT